MNLFDREPLTSPGSPHSTSEIEVNRFDVPLAHLPRELRGVTLVQLSDFHRGCGGTDALICEAVDQANGLAPDYVLITGDFVNEHKHDILPAIKMVSGIRARRGVFAVLGNHDHRSDSVLLTSALEAAGVQVLHNRGMEVAPGLHIAGIDDLLEGSPDLEGVLSKLPSNEAVVFLSHNPNAFDLIPEASGILVLSGHTHGGQLSLPFPSPSMICRLHLHTRYVHGWYRRGAASLYVNRGIGVTGARPLARRYKCPPEITQFKLVPASGE